MATDLGVDPRAARERPARFGLLHDRTFRRFWSAATVSFLGDQVSLVALPLLAVLTLDADASAMGLLVAVGVLPNLLLALWAGAWVDRHGRRRRVMVVADLVRFAALATIPAAHLCGVLTFAQLYVVAFAVGTATVFFFVADSTLFVSVVPRERYVEAQSLLYGSRAFSFVAGQGLGGVLVAVITAPLTMLVDALSFLWSAWFLARIDPVEPPTAEPGRGQVTAGLRFIRGSAIVRALLGASATVNLFTFGFAAVFVLYVTRELGLGAAALGVVLGIGAVGGLVGAAITHRLAKRIGVGPAFVVGCVLFPAPLLLVPLAHGGWSAAVLLVLAEFGSAMGVMVLDISIGSIFAAVIPDELRARVTGAYMVVNFGVRPVGAVLGGVLGTWLGLRPTLAVCAIGATCCALWLVGSPVPRMRDLP